MPVYILADNQYITREGLISLLHQLDDNAHIVIAGSCNELCETLRMYPDGIVILDYTLFDCASADQFLNIKTGAEASSWLLFSEELSGQFLRQVLLADSSISVVMKQEQKEHIAEALQSIAADKIYWCETAVSILKNNLPQSGLPNKLTASERMILHEIALGKTTKEIAWEKHLSFHTVNTHRRNIFRKLEVNNVHEAIKYAFRAGLIDLAEYYI